MFLIGAFMAFMARCKKHYKRKQNCPEVSISVSPVKEVARVGKPLSGGCWGTDHRGGVMVMEGVAVVAQIQLVHISLLAVGAHIHSHADQRVGHPDRT